MQNEFRRIYKNIHTVRKRKGGWVSEAQPFQLVDHFSALIYVCFAFRSEIPAPTG